MKNLKSLKEAVIAVLIDRLDEQDPSTRTRATGVAQKARPVSLMPKTSPREPASLPKTTGSRGPMYRSIDWGPKVKGSGPALATLATLAMDREGLQNVSKMLSPVIGAATGWMAKPEKLDPETIKYTKQDAARKTTLSKSMEDKARKFTQQYGKQYQAKQQQQQQQPQAQQQPQPQPQPQPKPQPKKPQQKTKTQQRGPKGLKIPKLPDSTPTENKPQMPKFGIEAKKKPKEQPVKKPTTTDRKDTTSYVGHYYKGLEKKSGTQYK